LEDLKNIIKGCISGNARDQEKLYQMFAPKMFGVCLRYARDRGEAEDNLQEGFIKIFNNLKTFRHEGSFEGWMRKIMVNVSLEKFRKQQRITPVEDMGKYEGQPVAEDALSKMGVEELLGLVQQLPPRYRMVFNLFVMEGMDHQAISKALDISVGTSKSNLSRARDILKRNVTEIYGEVESKTKYPA